MPDRRVRAAGRIEPRARARVRPAGRMSRIAGRLGAVSSADLRAENERLQAALRARLEEVEALRRVATLVARNAPPEEVLDVVTREAAQHLQADAAMTARFEGPGRAVVLSDWAGPGLEALVVPAAIALDPGTVLEQIQRTGRPARTDSYAELDGVHVEEIRDIGMRAGVGAPILVEGELWGAVAAGSATAPFTADHEQRLHAFAELVGQAIANVDARVKLQRSRARIVEAADAARRKLERDLHDGAQQRLVGLALQLRLLDRRLGSDAGIEPCIQELLGALEDLRDLARGLHPVVLTERGLVAALEALAARSVVPATVRADLAERLPGPQEIALYFVANEALANVAKYASATHVEIRVERDAEHASIAISDDGVGGASPEGGSGLRGLRDRVEALGGRLHVESPRGAGTTLSARVPLTGG
jgi:signal transduction histidine kinase